MTTTSERIRRTTEQKAALVAEYAAIGTREGKKAWLVSQGLTSLNMAAMKLGLKDKGAKVKQAATEPKPVKRRETRQPAPAKEYTATIEEVIGNRIAITQAELARLNAALAALNGGAQ